MPGPAEKERAPAIALELYPVYRAINRPLTILGTDRRLFFLAAVMAGATFNFFASLRAAALIYVVLFGAARWATARDLELPRIFLNSARLKVRYDAARFDPPASTEKAAWPAHGTY